MTIRKAWTGSENAGVAVLYFDMLDLAVSGQAYNKAAMIRNLQKGILSDRSRGSIESKLMNASAAHADIAPNDTTMSGFGYRPLSNYQATLRDAIKAERIKRYLRDGINEALKEAVGE